MVEESPESFISRWRQYAADVEMFAHTEGSPLLECRVGGAVLQLFERTGPYLSRPGLTRMIVNPSTEEIETLAPDQARPHVESSGLGKMLAVGRVIAVDGRIAVLDAGVPLVVNLDGRSILAVTEGEMVKVASVGPIHGFVVTRAESGSARRNEAHDDSI